MALQFFRCLCWSYPSYGLHVSYAFSASLENELERIILVLNIFEIDYNFLEQSSKYYKCSLKLIKKRIFSFTWFKIDKNAVSYEIAKFEWPNLTPTLNVTPDDGIVNNHKFLQNTVFQDFYKFACKIYVPWLQNVIVPITI